MCKHRKKSHVNWGRLRSEESGQSLVLVTLGMLVLLGFVALAVDGGYAYSQRRQMQIAADAAVVVGTRGLALDATTSELDSAIRTYAAQNGAPSVEWRYIVKTITGEEKLVHPDDIDLEVLLGGEPIGISVAAAVTFPTFFGGVVNISEMTASGTAGADFSGVNAIGNLMPIAVYDFDYQYGQTYDLWDHDLDAPGAFGWLRWTGADDPQGGSDRVLKDNIAEPSNSGVREIGEEIYATTGTHSGVGPYLQEWVGRSITLVLYDEVNGEGANTRYRVSGFAEFVLEGQDMTGQPKRVWGKFVTRVVPGDGDGPRRGLSTVNLRW